jgi:hypothetical protein
MEPLEYLSVSKIAERWGISTDKVARTVEPYRGKEGFMDLGSAGNVRKHVRKYAIIRIHPTLLKEIEGDLNGRLEKTTTHH